MPELTPEPSLQPKLGDSVESLIRKSGDGHVKIRRLFIAWELEPNEWDIVPITEGMEVKVALLSYSKENTQFTTYIKEKLDELDHSLASM